VEETASSLRSSSRRGRPEAAWKQDVLWRRGVAHSCAPVPSVCSADNTARRQLVTSQAVSFKMSTANLANPVTVNPAKIYETKNAVHNLVLTLSKTRGGI
jgi:hypothetical protein